jgi:predicted  nucleic acid-binding Zn-ribbon protein
MSSDLNKEKNRLNRLIREKHQKINELESKVSDLKQLEFERNNLKIEAEELASNKSELETFINNNVGKKKTLSEQIELLTTQKNQIDSYIETNNPTKQNLSNEIQTLKTEKDSLKNEIEVLKSDKLTTESEITKINQEKSRLDDLIAELRDKFGLYSKDMRDMSLDSITQLKKYSWSAVASISLAIILMVILLKILTKSDPFSERLLKFFYHEPNLRFYSILTIRISISAAFIFLIIIFLNLSRGFVSQYIKARNRLTALRVADFLIARIQSKKNTGATEEQKLKIEFERIKEQVELLNTHIPKIMDLGSSSFDKVSKTKDPIEQLKELKEIIKASNDN